MLTMKPLLTLILISVVTILAYPQTYQLTGQVTDEKGQPVPFASIYPNGAAHTGTSANSEGVFKLTLAQGTYELVVRSVGYRQAIEPVVADHDKHLRITLLAESYLLDEVVIGNGEDPAYAIIRQAIRQRRKYLHEAAPYTANVYIKGVQHLLQAPKKFLGVDIDQIGREISLDSNLTGNYYPYVYYTRYTRMTQADFYEYILR